MSIFKNSICELKISNQIDPEYMPYIEDLVRMIILQITIQFMYHIKDSTSNAFITTDLFELIMYIILGVSVYWLLFKKIVRFT